MNRWNIPSWLEHEVAQRDTACIYCGAIFAEVPESRRSRASWEHIINDARIITLENIALCCIGCNSSKGAKSLKTWLTSKYCLSHGINYETIAPVARAALDLSSG